jgi:hypothetical protein
VNGGAQYIIKELPMSGLGKRLEVDTRLQGSMLSKAEVYELKSMWNERSQR